MEQYHGYRIFQGNETRQINGVTGQPANQAAWYCEPEDYAGDVLWSPPLATKAAAQDFVLDNDPE